LNPERSQARARKADAYGALIACFGFGGALCGGERLIQFDVAIQIGLRRGRDLRKTTEPDASGSHKGFRGLFLAQWPSTSDWTAG